MENNQGQTRIIFWGQTTRYLLPIFIIPIFIFCVSSYFFHRYDIKMEKAQLEKLEALNINHQKELILTDFRLISADLHYLAEQHLLHWALDKSDPAALNDLAQDWLHFLAQKKIYDQVRFLDKNGMERIRINYNTGSPVVIALENLQDKSNRYYFTKAFKLEQDAIYVSPFDLNIERDQVEVPYKPMIRFASPVFDPNGKKKGIVVLNYLGAELLDSFETHSFSGEGALMLLNRQGYWLKAITVEDEWGFMFAGKKDVTFGKRYPKAWTIIAQNEGGQFYNEHGLFTYTTVRPVTRYKTVSQTSKNIGQENGWKIVSILPQERFKFATLAGFFSSFANQYVIIIIFYFVVACFLSAVIAQRKFVEKALWESEERLRTLINATPDIVSFKDADGRLLVVNESYLDLFLLKNVDYQGKTTTELAKYSAVHQEALLTAKETDEVAWHAETYHRSEETITFPTGNDLILDVIKVPLYDRAGQRQALIVIGRDITEKKQAEEELQKQATVDMLTGTFNRRAGIIWLEKHMKLVTRSNSVVTICYLDVNDLKHVNDTYGHDEGDSLIKVVVATVQKFLRGSDIICRLGGDEFLIALLDCDQAQALQLWQRVEQEFVTLNRQQARPYALSASYGFASFRGQDEEISADEFIALADKEMYKTKQIFKRQKWSQQ